MNRTNQLFKIFLLSVCFQCICTVIVKAQEERYAALPLRGSSNQIAKDSSNTVEDTVFFNLSLRPVQTTNSVTNYVTFKLNEFANLVIPDSFKVTITFKAYYAKLVGSSVVSDSTALQTVFVDYNKLRTYQNKTVFKYTGGYRSQVKILSVTSNLGTFSAYKNVLMLENEIVVNRNYNFDPNVNTVQSISGILGSAADGDSCSTAGEYIVNWGKIISATEYDLEWTYIDSTAISNYYKPSTTIIDPVKIFRNNASRVTITSESYQIPLLYDNGGILFYRVRPAQMRITGQRIEGQWSSFYASGMGQYGFAGHERNLNWQASTSYAEEGKRKSVVQYFDGTLRNRQTATKDNNTCFTIVAESIYDYQGRPAIQVMPAPTLSRLIGYTPNLTRTVGNTPYDKTVFDGDASNSDNNCSAVLPGMGIMSGASKYYSSNNSLVNIGMNQFIPNANLFPFTETRYTPDNTGRIAMQGGVGQEFQINYALADGYSHETKYFYAGADQEELDALFGTEVGNASHYSKNMVKDANGQYSVSYVDMHGRTIATALAGKPIAKLDTLTSSNYKLITKKLIDTTNNLVIGTSIIASKNLMVTRSGPHRFQYSLSTDSITLRACNSNDICYDCLYNLEISISNDCANPNDQPYLIKRTNYTGATAIDTACNVITAFPSVDTSINLSEGSYTITKILTISPSALIKYNEIFLRRNTCRTLQQLIDSVKNAYLSGLECAPTCQNCMDSLGTVEAFRNRYMLNNNIPAADSASFREQALLAYQAMLNECNLLCQSTGLQTSVRQQMLADMTPPYGQYAEPDGFNDKDNIFYKSSSNPVERFHAIPSGSYYKNEYGLPDSLINNSGIKVPVTDPSITEQNFLDNWKSTWAETLLLIHPEYCKLVKMESYAASYIWDERFSRIETFKQAVDSGFLNPSNFAQPSVLPASAMFNPPAASAQDPFFTSLATSYKPAFQTALVNYVTAYSPNISAWSIATVMAHCKERNAACLDSFKNISTAFSLDTSCSGELDFAWRYFREIYLNKKAEIIDGIFNSTCTVNIQTEHTLNFNNTSPLDAASGITQDSTSGRDSLTNFINTNCKAYVMQWMKEMKPCNLTLADSNQIIPRLIAVCNAGGDQNHLFGSSTTKSGTTTSGTYQDSSFIQVLKSVLGTRYDSTCNAYLLTAPQPYDKQPPYDDIEIYTKPDSCQCTKITSYYTQYQQVHTEPTFSDFIYKKTGQRMNQGVLDSLRMLCNGQITCSFLKTPLVIPTALQCNTASSVCASCLDVNTAYSNFKTTFPGVLPSLNDVDSFQIKRNKLFENYMNYNLGFAKSTSEYLKFLTNCSIAGTDNCDSLQYIIRNFKNATRPGRMVHNLKTQENVSYTNLSLTADNGTIHFPDSVRALSNNGYNNYEFNIASNSFCTSNGYSIEVRFKQLFTIQNGDVFNTLFGGKDIGVQRNFGGFTGLSTASFGARTSIDSDPNAINRWMTLKMKFLPNHYYIYYNGNVIFDSVLATPVNLSGKSIFVLANYGRQLCVDYVKLWDSQDNLKYFEDFTDPLNPSFVDSSFVCPPTSCQTNFVNYFNQQKGTSYTTFAQVDSVYMKNCQTHPSPCSPSIADTLLNLLDKYRQSAMTGSVITELSTRAGGVSTGAVITYSDITKLVDTGSIHFSDSLRLQPESWYSYYGVRPTGGKSFCTANNGYSVEMKFKYLSSSKTGDLFYTGFGDATTTDFTIQRSTSGPNTGLYFNYKGINYQLTTNPNAIFNWCKYKLQVTPTRQSVYFNDVLVFQRDSAITISNRTSFGIALYGGRLALFDDVRIWDGQDNLKYYEGFSNVFNPALVDSSFICPASDCQSSFVSYFNQQRSTNYSFAQIDSVYSVTCRVHPSPCSYFSPTYAINGPTLCGSTDPIFGPRELDALTPCGDSTLFSVGVGTKLFNAYKDSLTGSFNNRYLDKCLKARYSETFTVSAPISEFHYTLYYYDQAGNLVKTIPPEGVDVSKMGDVSFSTSVKTARASGTLLTPSHVLSTQYRYNTLNAVIAQITPDAGVSTFFYDGLGRLVLSQNARQKAAGFANDSLALYSNTLYDPLGRIQTVVQYRNVTAPCKPASQQLTKTSSQYGPWHAANNVNRHQITRTYYDTRYTSIVPNLYQQNLRNRVSYTTYTDTVTENFSAATYYSYDIAGNVDTLIQDFGINGATTNNIMNIHSANSNRLKRMVYRYDLISGKVNFVAYQPSRAGIYYPDMFFHRYSYDAENRLTLAEVSSDSVIWEKDARYNYYLHGPLARTTVGEQLVQGIDYAYTLQGWLKGVNAINLSSPNYDIGNDGKAGAGNQYVAKDALGFNLNYFLTDYAPIKSGVTPFPYYDLTKIDIPTLGKRPLYNGNINSMAVNINYLGGAVAPQVPQLYNYSYDQLNRITGMDVFRSSTLSTFNDWRDMLVVGDYKERVSYDANGNILRYLRQGFGSNLAMDSLTYNYNYTGGKLANNKLNYVTDKIGGSTAHGSNYPNDIENQNAGNYTYDAIGNLIADAQEGITSIQWNVYGKIRRITRTATGTNPITSIRYNYDAAGNRILKAVTRSATDSVEYTAYVRDANGNVMATYLTMDAPNGSINSSAPLLLREHHIYGSSRIGILNRNVSVGTSTFTNPSILNFIRGNKFFELSNHLQNVLVTISDKKIGVDNNSDGIIDYYNADVITANDYYPFGSQMPGRKYSQANTKYRYGFNGKENDNEVKGEGNQQDYGMRIYDPRLGRFLSVDPIAKSFPWNSPYAFAENDVIRSIDLDGLEKLLVEEMHDKYGRKTKTIISGIRDIALKAAVEMDMMSALNIRLAKKDVYIIRRRQDKSISFEGNGGNLSNQDISRIAKAPTDIGENDNSLPDGTMRQSQGTSRGNFYKSGLKDNEKNEFFEDQFNQKNSDPVKSASITVFSNEAVTSGTINGSALSGTMSQTIGSGTLSRVTNGIIAGGKDFLAKNNLNVGFVESLTLTVPNNNVKGWQQLKNNLATQFNISPSKITIKFDPDITAKDSGLPPGSITPVDGSLHVDAKYSGVNNGNRTNAAKGAINQ